MSAKIKTLILATRNAGKARELAEPLAGFGFAVKLPDASLPEVPETGDTFQANALLKAGTLAELTGCPALADDSGLIVDALHGQPGVHSARYGDDFPCPGREESRDARNIRKLLLALSDVPEPRAARFCCCMALVFPARQEQNIVVTGFWEGAIATAPRGENGFGYDPVFLDPASGLTAAEMRLEQKMARSHRGSALKMLLEKLGELQFE